jgi:hypothetical protein
MRGCGCRSCMSVDFGSSSCAPTLPPGRSPTLVAQTARTTQKRLAAEVLLHQRLVKLAPATGFDIDADALELLSRPGRFRALTPKLRSKLLSGCVQAFCWAEAA